MYDITNLLFSFAYYYPLFMAYLWMFGGIYYYWHWERRDRLEDVMAQQASDHVPVSILVPCHNEGAQVKETLEQLLKQDYPCFEIIAINDGSSDETGNILNQLQLTDPKIRVVHLTSNQGKGTALRMGALAAQHEILVCIDGDALLAPDAVYWMVRHFKYPRVAAVTGNPRIRNRSTILGKIQVGEFASIIGLIKRAQRIYGRVFTVSGVIAAFRKSALNRIGYWHTDMITEDIDISWRLQLDHWDIRFEPNALCWILMPETLQGLWQQRLRWAQGGAEVAMRHFKKLQPWHARRMWPIFIEYGFSVAWSYVVVAILILWLLGKLITLPAPLAVPTIVPGWSGVVLGITCFIQFLVSLTLDARYEKNILRHYFWVVWYPLAYWMINVLTISVGFPKAVLNRRNRKGTWVSPDRGVQAS